MSITLNSVLKAGYGDTTEQNKIANKNFILDKNLSNKNNFVYVNPTEKKIIHNVKGTNPFSFDDIKTDLYLGLGKLKDTNRYKDSNRIINNVRDKYKDFNITVTGRSLGSSIGQTIANKQKDSFIGLNGYYQPFKPTSSYGGKFQHYRSECDPISVFGANKTNVKTIQNKYNPIGLLPLDGLNAHKVNSINRDIFLYK